MATGDMLGAAVGALLRDGLIYVVTPAGEIHEVTVGDYASDDRWFQLGEPYMRRENAEAKALKIRSMLIRLTHLEGGNR